MRVAAVFGALWLMSSAIAALADDAEPREIARVAMVSPTWERDRLSDVPNRSFLSDVSTGLNQFALRDDLMTPKMAAEIRQQYEDLTREYDMRATHDLASLEEQRRHVNQMRDFTRGVLGAVRAHWVRKHLKRVEAAIDRDPTLKALSKPVGWIGAVVAFYGGQPFEVKLGEGTKAIARTEIPKRRSSLALQSPWIAAAVDFRTGSRPAGSPVSSRDEAYRVSASRGLPILDISSGVSYGGNGSMSASISRELCANVVGAIETTRRLASASGSDIRNEDTYRVAYRLVF